MQKTGGNNHGSWIKHFKTFFIVILRTEYKCLQLGVQKLKRVWLRSSCDSIFCSQFVIGLPFAAALSSDHPSAGGAHCYFITLPISAGLYWCRICEWPRVNNHNHHIMHPWSQTHHGRHGGHLGLQITNTRNTRAKSEDMEGTKRPQFCHFIFVLQFFGKKTFLHRNVTGPDTFQFANIIPPSNCKLHKAETLLIT